MPINQQLKNAIESIKFSFKIKQAEIAERLGVKNTYLSDMINGRVPFSDSMKEKLYEVFSYRVSEGDESLMQGASIYYGGEDLDIKKIREQLNVSQEKLAKMLGVHPRTVQNWESGTTIPKAKHAILRNLVLKPQGYAGDGESSEESTYVLLLPISAQGGSLNDFVVSVKDSDCEHVISPIRGVDFAMTVAGDSMAPEYPSGSQILIKKVNEKAFIDWGRVYVLDTCNGSVIKRIFPADDKDPRKVKCVSINPDYPPFEVSFEDIFGVYRVLLSMSIK